MYGRRTDKSSGQLALLDAIVFFAIAMTISSMTIYYARGEVVRATPLSPDGQSDPEAILRVFLRASLGEELVLELDRQVHVMATSEIVECLRVELDALSLGADVADFAPMNQRLLGILEGICTTVLDPYLVAIRLLDDGRQTILLLPGEPRDGSTRYASSAYLQGLSGSTFLLTLVLVPATLSEIVQVGACDLDLRPGVGHSSAHFKP